MSAGFNKVMLLGNIGRDPDFKTTQNGTGVLKFSVATTERYLDRNKERKERTEWHNVVVWGKQAEALSRIVQKGQQVFVEGKLSTESWEKDGKKQYRTNVIADTVSICGSRGEGGRGSRDSGAGDGFAGDDGGGDDDIPF